MYYYEIGLGVDRHWQSGVFTYSHEAVLKPGTVVRVPFGNKKKHGVILGAVKKPAFNLKLVDSIYDIKLNSATTQFINWYTHYYAASPAQAYSQFLPGYLTAKIQNHVEKYTEKHEDVPMLSAKQEEALNNIRQSSKPVVLHGITGSGKTRIYTHLLLEQINNGKDALLLFPEISLTAQIVQEMQKYAETLVFHSQLTNSERSKLWYEIANSKKPKIIIGPRSALFLPHRDIGIVIIDEAHESSYKQENDIRYGSIYSAAGLCNAHKARLVLGSATPPISETKHIIDRGGKLVCLHDKALADTVHREISVIDAKNRKLFSKNAVVSDELLLAIEKTIQNKEQTLLFINRRGTAKLVLCSSDTCEWQAECERCDLPLTFHHDSHTLLCHTCGRKQSMPTICPVCSSKTTLKSFGSKAIVDDIAKLFPHARIGRFDSDTEKAESFMENYSDIKAGSIDILIGTQQLVKGIDLPKLATIGILNADLSMHFPDYSTDERTFQLITQAMGRVGRGHTEGAVILQTFQPTNPTITYAINEDWHGFSEKELHERKEHGFPPFSFYAKVIFRDKSYEKAYKKATESIPLLTQKNVHIDGPIPSYIAKKNGVFFVQLLLKSNSRNILLSSLVNTPPESIVDIDPASLL